MRLVYEISASDTQLRRVLRGVEQEARASSRRMAREQLGAMQGPGRKEAGQARRYEESQARASARAAEALDRQRSRSVLANVRNEERERMRSARSVAQAAEQLDRQRSRGLMQQFREQERAQIRAQTIRERTVRNIRGGAARTLSGSIGAASGLVGAGAAIAGGIGIAGALESRLAIQRKASMLANQSEAPETKGALMTEAQNNRGFTGEESLDFLTNFHEKGSDLTAARGSLADMSRLALATGTNLGELGSAAGSAFSVIKSQVKDPQEQLRILSDVMTTVAQQGSMGAIEMRNLVDGMGQLGGASRKFEGGPGQVLKSMGALAQVALQTGGAGSPDEAMTAVARFASDIPEHAKEFSKQGIDIFTDKSKSQLRSPEKILADMMGKTGGDLTKMGELFGVRSQKVAFGFSPAYLDAERENAALPASRRRKTGEAGKQALLAKYGGFANATRSAGELDAQAKSRLEDPDLQIKDATKQFNAAVGESLAPVAADAANEFRKFTPEIAEGTRLLGKFVGFLAQNPFEGVGLIVGAKIAKDIGAAGLENIISGEIKGKLGAALSGAGMGLTVATMIVTANVLNFAKHEAEMKEGGKALNEAREMAARGDTSGLEKLIQGQQERVDQATSKGFAESAIQGFGEFAGSLGGLKKIDPEQQKLIDQRAQLFDQNKGVNVKTQENFLEEMESLRKAAASAAKALSAVKPPDQRDTRNGPIKAG